MKRLKLPLSYELIENKDSRFTKARVKVCHNGLNLNHSTFSDEAIEKAASSLKNVPLLAFVKKVDGTESDFAGHEFEFKVTEDGIKYIYLGRPIGIIPETNNYSYHEDESGIKFVSVDAYIWNDYANEALDILVRDGGEKNVSMEISVDNYENDEETGVINIKDYKYTGVAILGDDVPPAMTGAKLQLDTFNFSEIDAFIAKFQEELQTEEDEAVDEEPTVEEEAVVEEPVEGEEAVVEEEAEEQVQEEIEEEVEVEGKTEEHIEAEDQYLQAEEEENFAAPETMNPIENPLPEGNQTVATDVILKSEYDELLAKFNELEDEVKSLREYKENVEKAKFEEKIEKLKEEFSDLDEVLLNSIIEDEKNLEVLELKLYAERGKMSKDKPATIQSFAIYDSLVSSNQNNKMGGPSWETLVAELKSEGGIK